jgi:hypothetical protein
MCCVPGAVAKHSLEACVRGASFSTVTPSRVCMVTLSVAASKTICWSGRVNPVNTMCVLGIHGQDLVERLSGGRPFIAQIGPPMEGSTRKPRKVFHSRCPPVVAIARVRRSSVIGTVLSGGLVSNCNGLGDELGYGDGLGDERGV